VVSSDADETALERLATMRECTTRRCGSQMPTCGCEDPAICLGARQTGALPLKFVHLIRDHRTIERARKLADEWLARDPSLASRESEGARAAVKKMLALGFSLGDVG